MRDNVRNKTMQDSKCSVEQCDIFDFMANYVGMTVLHPGGLLATNKLAEKCHITRDSKVLDIGCGKGTSAVYLAKQFHCQITGIDVDERLIDQAKKLAQKEGVFREVKFLRGDALRLPFSNDEFDVTLSQALLVLVSDKKQVIREAIRVTKPGGFIGWLELSFYKQPPESLIQASELSACAFCIRNTLTFDEWKKLFQECGISDLEVIPGEMGMRQRNMFRDEGFLNAAKIIGKWLFNSRIRKRMNVVFDFFRNNKEYIGYGIYVGKNLHKYLNGANYDKRC